MCRDASGDLPARPGVSRRLTLRGVLAVPRDGVAAGDELAVALRRVGIAAWLGGKIGGYLGDVVELGRNRGWRGGGSRV